MAIDQSQKGVLQKLSHVHPVYWMVLILLLAALLRVYGIYNISPPGLEHDEVANWLIDRAILDGNHAFYFTEAYGHEAGFHYLQAISVAILGDHALALRLPAAFAGLLLVAIHYTLVRRLFGLRVALISAAFLTVLFWGVFYSRLGLRAILLPLVSGLSLFCWWEAWRLKRMPSRSFKQQTAIRWLLSSAEFYFVLAGLLAGLTLYTYMAARAVPIFYLFFILYLAFFHRTELIQCRRGLLLFVLIFVIIAAPLVIFLLNNPGAEFRISEVDAPLRALRDRDLQPVLTNSLKIMGMFGFSGDPLWRQNVAGRPVFGPVLALLFYAGIIVALWRWKRPRYAFLILWLGTAAAPSIVTVDAPSTIRMVNALLIVTVFPAIVIHKMPWFSTKMPKLSTVGPYLLALLLVFAHIWWTAQGVFHIWPVNDEVQFVWQASLTETAAYLDAAEDDSPVTIAGWSPATLDPTTMLLSMKRRDLDLRYTGSDSQSQPIRSLIIPGSESATEIRITRPDIREFSPDLESQLTEWGARMEAQDSFVLYELPTTFNVAPQVAVPTFFGDHLRFLGYSYSDHASSCSSGVCRILSFWRVQQPPDTSLSFFLHATDEQGNLLAQDDGLDAPAHHWRSGDIIVQNHLLDLNQLDVDSFRLGVYVPQTGRRLLLPDGADYFSFSLP
jgi:4-amino-4-deoxy-L-arabinose transferase-like glycosyltransferase